MTSFGLTACSDGTPSNDVVESCVRDFATVQQSGGYTCGEIFDIDAVEILSSKSQDKDYIFETIRRMTLKKTIWIGSPVSMHCQINGGNKGEKQAIRSNFLVEKWSNGYKCSLMRN